MTRGGKRDGAGRKVGSKGNSERTQIYSARVTPKEKTSLKEHLKEIRLTGGG